MPEQQVNIVQQDYVAPLITSIETSNKCNNTSVIGIGDTIYIELEANEWINKPSVSVMETAIDMQMMGGNRRWFGELILDNTDELAHGDVISLNISYADKSGMNGINLTEDDHGALTFCDANVTSCQCFSDDISGVWRNANKINAMGVGPFEGDTSYWNVDDFELGRRSCVFDDTYTFVADENEQSGGGIFSQEMDGWTWIEAWASPDSLESCGDPTLLEDYPWDGLETGQSYIWNPQEAELSVLGQGAHIGFPRVTNGGDASSDGPASIVTYNVETASFCHLSLNILGESDLWWHFELERVSFPDPNNANNQFSLEDYPDYCSLGPDMFGSDSSDGSGDTSSANGEAPEVPDNEEHAPVINAEFLNMIKFVAIPLPTTHFCADVQGEFLEILISGEENILLNIGDNYSDEGATACDLNGGDNLVDQDASTEGIQALKVEGLDTLDTSIVGYYQISYTAADSDGNIASVVRTIEVRDLTPPIITISGINPAMVSLSSGFVAPYATFYDVFDEETTSVTNITNNVDIDTLGTYTVIYRASDASGNEATKTLTVIVEPDYQDELVVFQNGTLKDAWFQNGYDVDLSWGDCPANNCPNLDFGMENDATKGRDVMYIDYGEDNTAQAGFFLQTTTPHDLSGAEVNGKLSFEVWSDSPEGVDLNVAVDCPGYPNAGNPVMVEGVGAQQWQEVSIPAADLFSQSCALRSDEIGSINMFLRNWMGPKIRIDNVVWKCEFSCDGSHIPDAEYTPWVKTDKTSGYDAPTSYTGYDLVWSDEFDGTAIDQTKWNLVNAGGGFGNFELQYYRSENAAVEDGLLVITADIQQSDDAELPGGESFSSAKLTTQDKFEFKHGRVDIRASVAEGKGMWSAGWMLGANVDDIGWPFAGEIDIFETIGGVTYGVDQENRILHNAYWNAQGPFSPGQSLRATYSPSPSGQNLAWGERELVTEGETFSNTFHVFSIVWDEEKIRYMIDGVHQEGRDLDLTTNIVSPCPYGQVANEPQLSCVGQSFNNDFFLILNVPVGGIFPGAPDDTTQFPRGMLVDYVRVYQTAQGNTSPIVSDEPGSGDTGSGDTGSANGTAPEVPADNDNNLLSGNWQFKQSGTAVAIGPSIGDASWWPTDSGSATVFNERSCLFDDVFSFDSTDNSFVKDIQDGTWIEGWASPTGSRSCGVPVAPYDGSVPSSYAYDADASTLTLYGQGAYLGLGKVINDTEIGDIADAPNSITYTVSSLTHTSMTLNIYNGEGYWRYMLVCVDDSCVGGDADPVEPGTGTEAGGVATFTGTFDGFLANSETNTFEFPASAQSWAGVVNDNQALYPLSFPSSTTLNFLASSDEPVTVKFTFEYNPWPDVNPTFSTDEVVVNGDCQAYSVDIPAQGTDTFSSYLMYIIERDIPVTVSNVVIGGDAPSCDVANEPEPEPVPNDSTITPLNITKASNAAGMEFLGLGCEIGLNGLLDDDICPSPNDIVSSQVAYISNSIMSGKQKVVTVSYTSDDSTTTGVGFGIHFNSSALSLNAISDVLAGAIAQGQQNPDVNDLDNDPSTDQMLSFGWASLFGTFPGSQTANLATITFDINTKNQFVSVSGNPEGVFGKKVPVNIGYSVSDFNNQLTGLGVRVHFNSNLLSISDVTNILPKDLITPAYGPVADEENYDNDDSTDVYITFGWASLYGEWTDQTLPTNIATIEFDVINQHNNEDYEFTNINFTANSTPPDYNFVPENYTLPLLLATWDFDGSGNIDALTDGLLLLRYSFGMRGQALTNNVVASSTSLSHEEVALSLEDSIQIADIDGDGKVDALTDGLLLLRYMFGLRDEILIDQVVSESAQRNNKELITNYIEKHMPKN